MKAVVPLDVLLAALQQVARAVPASSPIPVLSGICLIVAENRLTLTASNGVMSIGAEIPLNEAGSDAGSAAGLVVPARYFAEIVRKLPAPLVELELAERATLLIRSGGSRFRLCGSDAEQFPEPPSLEQAPWRLTLPNALLKAMIRQVAFAVSSSETRPLLSGVLCRFDGRNLRFVATDSVRFASRSTALDTAGAAAAFEAVIPGKGLSELAKLLQDGPGETNIAADGGHIRFATARLTLWCSLLHGAYPPIDKLVPSACVSEVIVNTLQALHAVERVTVLAGEGCLVRLRAGADAERSIELSSGSTEVGDVREELGIERRDGEPIAIAFNGTYMADILRAIDSETVSLRFTDKLGPIVAEPAVPRPSSVFLLTPIRTAV